MLPMARGGCDGRDPQLIVEPEGGPDHIAPVSLQVRDLSKSFYGVHAVDGVSFDLVGGEIHGLLGENGAGKSTLCSMLAGLYRPDAGQILIDGVEVHFRSPDDAAAHGIGMVYQHFRLVDSFTVAENIVLGHGEGVGRRARREVEARVAPARRGLRPRGGRVGAGMAALGRRATARGDPLAAVPRRADPDPRRADGGARSRRIGSVVRRRSQDGRPWSRRGARVAQDAGDPRPHRPGDRATRRPQRRRRRHGVAGAGVARRDDVRQRARRARASTWRTRRTSPGRLCSRCPTSRCWETTDALRSTG